MVNCNNILAQNLCDLLSLNVEHVWPLGIVPYNLYLPNDLRLSLRIYSANIHLFVQPFLWSVISLFSYFFVIVAYERSNYAVLPNFELVLTTWSSSPSSATSSLEHNLVST